MSSLIAQVNLKIRQVYFTLMILKENFIVAFYQYNIKCEFCVKFIIFSVINFEFFIISSISSNLKLIACRLSCFWKLGLCAITRIFRQLLYASTCLTPNKCCMILFEGVSQCHNICTFLGELFTHYFALIYKSFSTKQ